MVNREDEQTHVFSTGRLKDVSAHAMNFFKSVLLIAPIGLISAVKGVAELFHSSAKVATYQRSSHIS